MKYMKKLFASDFDNTLYFRQETPPIRPGIADAVKRFQEAGHLFGICTGRPARGLEEYYMGIFRPDFIIGSSGAVILDRDGKTLMEQTVSFDTLRELERSGRDRGFTCAVQAEGRFLLLDREGSSSWNMPRIQSLDEVYGRAIHGISFLTGSDTAAGSFVREIGERFSDSISAWQNRTAVDVNAAGCSKGNALQQTAALLQADRTYGMGDSLNDLPLVSSADVGFTFRTAPEVLQHKAARLVDTAEEAILQALEDAG